MIRSIIWTLGILGLLLIFQSTVVSYFVFWSIKPNILLIVFVLLATQNGSFVSQTVGFLLGLMIDMVTNVPLGFHALQFCLAGYLFGLGSGKVFFDPLVMPTFLGFLATLYDIISRICINSIFHLGEPISSFINIGVLFQIILNMILAPIIFWLYSWLKDKFQNPKRGFGL